MHQLVERALFIAFFGSFGAACSSYDPSQAAETDVEVTGASEQALVGVPSGTKRQLVTSADGNSETAAVQAADGDLVVAYNSDDPQNVGYANASDRYVCRGARGVSYGKSGLGYVQQQVAVPAGYAFLWGDPSMAGGLGRLAGTSDTLFLTTLASPLDRYKAAVATQNQGHCYHGGMDETNTPLAGACIARSDDNGATFNIDPATDCVRDGDHFYDGGSAAVSGKVAYAAFWDTNRNNAAIWSTALGAHHAFTPVPRALRDGVVIGHPLIFGDPTGITLVVPTSRGYLLTQYTETAALWSLPVTISPATGVDTVTLRNGRAIRSIGGYAGAIGHSGTKDTELWFVYSQNNALGKAQLYSVNCQLHPSVSCGAATELTDPNSNAFLPAVGFASSPVQGQPPAGYWQVSYQSDAGTNDPSVVKLRSSPLGVTPVSIRRTNDQIACPDDRGYWGDYDAMVGIDATTVGGTPTFTRFMTDSTGASCTHQMFNASPQRVSAVSW